MDGNGLHDRAPFMYCFFFFFFFFFSVTKPVNFHSSVPCFVTFFPPQRKRLCCQAHPYTVNGYYRHRRYDRNAIYTMWNMLGSIRSV